MDATETIRITGETLIYCANSRGFANEQGYLPLLPGYEQAARREADERQEASDREMGRGRFSVMRFDDLPTSQRQSILHNWAGTDAATLRHCYSQNGWAVQGREG